MVPMLTIYNIPCIVYLQKPRDISFLIQDHQQKYDSVVTSDNITH